jgi:phosphoglycolate phosphatase-like HAD superfamily hydrolase
VRKLILWDIDGTLIRTGGAGVRAMTRAFSETCGIADALHRVEVAGRTDRLIMTDALALSGRPLDDALERPDLLPVALTRYHSHTARAIDPAHVIIVGDTPHDVTCAKSGGAKVVAVATGTFSAQALAEFEPDVVFEDLSDREAFMSAISTL